MAAVALLVSSLILLAAPRATGEGQVTTTTAGCAPNLALECPPFMKEQSEAAVEGPSPPGLLILDVDAGADDALAMLLVLRQEELARTAGEQCPRIAAITCTHGNTALENVQRNVLKTLHLAGRLDIPVFSGAYDSLITTPRGDSFFGTDGFGDFEYENAPDPAECLQKSHAADVLVWLARKYPGQITLLTTGPLTNVALATRLDPHFLNNLQQLVVMGGSTDGSGNIKPGVEFNFFLDPEASYIVFNSTTDSSKPIYLVPWDTVATKNLINVTWRLDVLGKTESSYMNFLNKAERLVLKIHSESGYWISADPIAAAMLIRPDLITKSVKHHIDAETRGAFSRGAILVDYNDRITPKNTLIIKDFDVEKYKDLLLKNLS